MPLIIDDSYLIEDTKNYKRLKPDGIKSVEFIRKRKNILLFIEAKSTFAKVGQINFDTESLNVVKKFLHSLNLLSAISLKVESDDISTLDNNSDKLTLIQFILIIRKTDERHCNEIKKNITNIIKQNPVARKIWRPTIRVMSYEEAINNKLAL
jgi:hypothetical protein